MTRGEKRDADGHADGATDRPLLKAMTSRRQVTDIWVFVTAAALSGRFHLIQRRLESARPRLRLPSLRISRITRTLVYSWVWPEGERGKEGASARCFILFWRSDGQILSHDADTHPLGSDVGCVCSNPGVEMKTISSHCGADLSGSYTATGACDACCQSTALVRI